MLPTFMSIANQIISMQFEYYVLNYNSNKRKVEMYNIFNNIHVQEWTEKIIKKYLRSPKSFQYKPYNKDEEVIYGFDALVKELDSVIRWQEWGRFEYEIGAGHPFETDCTKLEKWDCYQQCLPNIKTITREVIFQYKQQSKSKEDE